MRVASQRAHELLDQLDAFEAAAVERLLESLVLPAGESFDWDAAIQAGMDSIDAGKGLDADDYFEQIDRELAAEENIKRA